jgi:hypothetical protein
MCVTVPTLDDAVLAADRALHPRVYTWVPRPARLEALREELAWSVTTAVDDLEFARAFAAAQPQSGQPVHAYLNRWIDVTTDLTVLAGPRYRARDPERPFVAIDAATRPIGPADLPGLRAAVHDGFAAFAPRYLTVWAPDAAGSWPATGSDMRNLAGRMGELRRNAVPAELTARRAPGLDFYSRYSRIHHDQVARDPQHAVHTRLETRADLAALREAGTLFEVRRHEQWAGVIAAEPATQHGLRGFTVIELLLDPAVRGHGYGRHLSTLLARHLEAPDDAFLLGTIHVDNHRAYRSALAAGRTDVGGEVVVDLTA